MVALTEDEMESVEGAGVLLMSSRVLQGERRTPGESAHCAHGSRLADADFL
jgi:hypothetical protein